MVRPASVEDIQKAIQFCDYYCLRLGVRSGGHGPNQGARVLGGVTLDMRLMSRIKTVVVSREDAQGNVVKEGTAVVEGRCGVSGGGRAFAVACMHACLLKSPTMRLPDHTFA